MGKHALLPMPAIGSDPRASRPSANRLATRPALVDVFSPFCVVDGYFHSIDVPTTVTIITGQQGWYIFRRVKIEEQTGVECALVSAHFEMLPTDSAGGAITGITSPLAWGEATGNSAAIVVAPNIQGEAGTWLSKPAYIPGIDYGEATPSAQSLVSDAAYETYPCVQHFPPGTFRDAVPNQLRETIYFAPSALRLKRTDTLDVALVVAPRFVNALGAAGQLVSRVNVRLTLALTHNLKQFSVDDDLGDDCRER